MCNAPMLRSRGGLLREAREAFHHIEVLRRRAHVRWPERTICSILFTFGREAEGVLL
jgi:hypothetical protein